MKCNFKVGDIVVEKRTGKKTTILSINEANGTVNFMTENSDYMFECALIEYINGEFMLDKNIFQMIKEDYNLGESINIK